jgi:outer membrane protein OmpA-like peptidoglycan-associated protein
MRGKRTILLRCGVMWLLLWAVAWGLDAPPKDRLDLTGREELTPEEIVRGLLPRYTRGIAPALPTVAITVRFDFNSAKIGPAAAQNLRSVGIALQSAELGPYRIRIEGHTDSIGSDQYNLKLSERRANSVKQFLIQQYRLAPERLVTLGRGKQEPIAENETPEGRQKNRRVEFVNVGSE